MNWESDKSLILHLIRKFYFTYLTEYQHLSTFLDTKIVNRVKIYQGQGSNLGHWFSSPILCQLSYHDIPITAFLILMLKKLPLQHKME